MTRVRRTSEPEPHSLRQNEPTVSVARRVRYLRCCSAVPCVRSSVPTSVFCARQSRGRESGSVNAYLHIDHDTHRRVDLGELFDHNARGGEAQPRTCE